MIPFSNCKPIERSKVRKEKFKKSRVIVTQELGDEVAISIYVLRISLMGASVILKSYPVNKVTNVF